MNTDNINSLVDTILYIQKRTLTEIDQIRQSVTSRLAKLSSMNLDDVVQASSFYNEYKKLDLAATYIDTLPHVQPCLVERDILLSNIQSLLEKHEIDNIEITHTEGHRVTIIIHGISAVIQENDPETRTSFSVPLGKFNIKISTNWWFSLASRSINERLMDGVYSRVYNSPVDKIVCSPVGDNNPRTIDGADCYHPHMIDGKLCLGSYADGIQVDIRTFNYYSILFNICSLVNRYNANSLLFPNAYIHNWIGHKCVSCFGFTGDSVVFCDMTKGPLHKNCAVEVDGRLYNPSKVKACSVCGKNTVRFTRVNNKTSICNDCPLP